MAYFQGRTVGFREGSCSWWMLVIHLGSESSLVVGIHWTILVVWNNPVEESSIKKTGFVTDLFLESQAAPTFTNWFSAQTIVIQKFVEKASGKSPKRRLQTPFLRYRNVSLVLSHPRWMPFPKRESLKKDIFSWGHWATRSPFCVFSPQLSLTTSGYNHLFPRQVHKGFTTGVPQ